jgi:hypothetical protein
MNARSETTRFELHGAKTGNCLRAAIGLSEARLTYRVRGVNSPVFALNAS